MNQIVTKGVILNRTNYQEADRILTFITPDQGKLRLIAKGVRKSKAKLAGSTELLSNTQITFIPSRGDIGTLISARLIKHYGNIVGDYDRTQMAYSAMKLIDRATREGSEEAYFDLINESLKSLNDPLISQAIIRLWLNLRVLSVMGHIPDFWNDLNGEQFVFDFQKMRFSESAKGSFTKDHIKILRLNLANSPSQLVRVNEGEKLSSDLVTLVSNLLANYNLPAL